VLAVVTGRDKKSSRGGALVPTPCRREADNRGIPVLMPLSLKDSSFHTELKSFNADLFVVVAFRVLPKEVFELPRQGSINIHGSLLPKYRGAAPIHWAIINGDSQTGLTSFFLKETVDTGDMIAQVKVEIAADDTFDSLYQRLAEMSAPFLLKTLDLIESDSKPVAQPEGMASRAPKLTASDALIDFGQPARHVRNFIRGLSTKPGSHTMFRGKKLKIHSSEIVEQGASQKLEPGTLIVEKKRLLVQCGSNMLELKRLVPEAKKEMDGAQFINGLRPETGEILGGTPTVGMTLLKESKENK